MGRLFPVVEETNPEILSRGSAILQIVPHTIRHCQSSWLTTWYEEKLKKKIKGGYQPKSSVIMILKKIFHLIS